MPSPQPAYADPVQEPFANTRQDEDSLVEVVFDEEDDYYDEPPPPRSPLRILLGWLSTLAVLVALGLVAFLAGERLYQPAGRIPTPPVYPPEHGLLGYTAPLLQQLVPLAALEPEGLELAGEPQRYLFPRTVGDRLWGKRREDALILGLRTLQGDELRALVLRKDGGTRLVAIEAGQGRGRADVFVGLPVSPAGEETPYSPLVLAIEALVAQVDEAGLEDLSTEEYSLFGPYARGEREELARRIESNVVMRHLARALEAAEADVSIAAPVYYLMPNPGRGSILGLYQPQLGIVLEPLWGDSSTATLAHELLHAHMDRVVADPETVLDSAAAYFEEAHPRLHGQVVGDLYQQLDRRGRAEETLAFIVGAVAAGQTRTVATGRALQNQGLLSVTEPILTSDLELLLALGLIPPCMDPAALGHSESEVAFAYYESARAACN